MTNVGKKLSRVLASRSITDQRKIEFAYEVGPPDTVYFHRGPLGALNQQFYKLL